MNHPPRNIDNTCFSWVKLILKTDLPPNTKYMALYLSTYMNLNQDMAFPSLSRIEGETGLAHATVIKHLRILEQEGWIIKQSGDRVTSNRYWIDVPKNIKNQVGQPLTYVNEREEVGQPLTSNNNIITSNTHSKGAPFKPPTIEQILTYITEKNLSVDGHHFYEYFTAGNWHDSQGKPVKNWKQKLLTWHKAENKHGNNTKPVKPNQNTRRLSPLERAQAARQAAHDRTAQRTPDMGCVADTD